MSLFEDRTRTALLVIDVQNDVVTGAPDRDGVVARIADLVERARAAGAPVVWVQHSDAGLPRDSEGWRYVPELAAVMDGAGEPVVHKSYGDSFEDTELEQVLADAGVGSLVVAGAQSDMCIRSTLHGALVRGYDAVLVADAHTNLYWGSQRAPGRSAGTVAAAEVVFA